MCMTSEAKELFSSYTFPEFAERGKSFNLLCSHTYTRLIFFLRLMLPAASSKDLSRKLFLRRTILLPNRLRWKRDFQTTFDPYLSEQAGLAELAAKANPVEYPRTVAESVGKYQ